MVISKWFAAIEVRSIGPAEDAFVARDHGAVAHLVSVLKDIGASPVGA